MLEVHQIPVLSDNYVYLLHDTDSEATAVVDPAVAAPVLEAAEQRGWRITHILNTHHHPDHVGGNLEIKAATDCAIIGAANDTARLPGLTQKVSEGDSVSVGSLKAQVIEVPGHTTGHIAYWFAADHALFCGDTLFVLGCGRMFEGTPPMFWNSLAKLKALPDETRVYCAHEYSLANAKFALSVDPQNKALQEQAAEIESLRADNLPTVPSLLGREKAANPFLRADEPEFAATLGLGGATPEAVFKDVRTRKDNF